MQIAEDMNVALIDQHPMFRSGIRVLLKSQFDDITTLETASMQSPGLTSELGGIDLIIIGLSEERPDLDREVLRRLMRSNPLASFIIYASKPDHRPVSSLMRMGVKGYLAKTGDLDDLGSCVRSVMAGIPYVCRQLRR